MGTGRIEAFSDGVIAVIITIMVLDLKVPHDAGWAALAAEGPAFAIYALSFVVVAIFWMNHHHLLHTALRADAPLLWSNTLVLFVLSLIPFVTAYVASARGSALPVACYGLTLGLASAAFTCLTWVVAEQQLDPAQRRSTFNRSLAKGSTVFGLYLLSIGLAFVSVYVAYVIFLIIPILYVLPDRRFAAT